MKISKQEIIKAQDLWAENIIKIGKLYLQKGNFKDGKQEGLWEYYYESGKFRQKGNYVDGKLEGLVEEYYENGQLYYERNFKDGKEEGLSKYYRENGQLKQKGKTRKEIATAIAARAAGGNNLIPPDPKFLSSLVDFAVSGGQNISSGNATTSIPNSIKINFGECRSKFIPLIAS